MAAGGPGLAKIWPNQNMPGTKARTVPAIMASQLTFFKMSSILVLMIAKELGKFIKNPGPSLDVTIPRPFGHEFDLVQNHFSSTFDGREEQLNFGGRRRIGRFSGEHDAGIGRQG